MKQITITDKTNPKITDSETVKTGLVIYKSKNKTDSIKFIDNLQFIDAVGLMTNATLFLMKTYESLGIDPEIIYDQFDTAYAKAFEAFLPDLIKQKRDAEAQNKITKEIEKMTSTRPEPSKILKKDEDVIDPYNV